LEVGLSHAFSPATHQQKIKSPIMVFWFGGALRVVCHPGGRLHVLPFTPDPAGPGARAPRRTPYATTAAAQQERVFMGVLRAAQHWRLDATDELDRADHAA
jgi:hypothetical protein